MSHIFVAYVEDKPGVLNRVASLMRRRAFNIESLTVGPTERDTVTANFASVGATYTTISPRGV